MKFLKSVLIFLALPLLAVEYPNYDEVFVNDFAEVLSPAQEVEMRDALQDLRENTGVEMVVVTIKRMSDYGYFAYDYHPFATGLFNHWGVGRFPENDGVLVLLSTQDRFARIELGGGYPQSYDAVAQRVFYQKMQAKLADNKFDLGLISGVREMIAELRVRNGLPDGRPWWQRISIRPEFVIFSFFGLVFAVNILKATKRGRSLLLGMQDVTRRAWPRKCKKCKSRTNRLSEFDKNAHLSPEQDMEMRLGSRDWQVYQCSSCGEIEVVGRRYWFAKYEECPQCHLIALSDGEEVLQKPKLFQKGQKAITSSCKNCNYSNTYTVSFSSRGGGGFGGFGGGSSRGGGGGGRF